MKNSLQLGNLVIPSYSPTTKLSSDSNSSVGSIVAKENLRSILPLDGMLARLAPLPKGFFLLDSR